MLFVVLTYILLLLIFFGVSGLILHHTMKYGYLAPRFKIVVGVFIILSVLLIVYSLTLLVTLDSSSSTSIPSAPVRNASGLNF